MIGDRMCLALYKPQVRCCPRQENLQSKEPRQIKEVVSLDSANESSGQQG